MSKKQKILLLGSGGLSIGQAGEFDYSGSQAVKALVEEGYHVIVINPNIATVQTNPIEDVTVYLYPVTPEWVEKIFEKEKPFGIVGGFGGQTALQCLIELDESGMLEKYGVKNLGTPASVLRLTEDRDSFAKKMLEIDMPIPSSFACESLMEAKKAACEIGFPVIVRAAFALGGLGSGFADNEEELKNLVEPALSSSPQVLVEKSLRGWKEIEYEVMRDCEGNTITICNMENFDPLGVHTGDSIVICPSQSLSDDEYQMLRNASLKIVNALGVIGECNVQLALDPKSHRFYVIEVNARLSRSSALASKASGYPIAHIAAKVVLGKDLLELKNPVTGVTQAFFEPAFDYVALKVPKWDLQKFSGVSRSLGSTMKSVGEIMAIGKTFPEVIQKAIRMVSENGLGISNNREFSLDYIANPTDDRIFSVYAALRNDTSPEEIHQRTGIDLWFLDQLRSVAHGEKMIESESFSSMSKEKIMQIKQLGFSDDQICFYNPELSRAEVRKIREKFDIRPVVKKIDTTAGEYPSTSNYLYFTYHGIFDDEILDDGKENKAIVLGGGSYRIGASVEFDWCAVSCSEELRRSGWRSIVVNCNPETVSTDFNVSDRLYFEELSIERIQDIADFEGANHVVASMGGQLPNKISQQLGGTQLKLLGHSFNAIDGAEDRGKFSDLLDRLGILQPAWIAAHKKEDIENFVDTVGFPLLIRPSYVLSGAAMSVVVDHEGLEECLTKATGLSPDHPVVVTEFINGAREIELDGVACKGEIYTAIVSEHIENAGVHSGDATTVVPAQNLYVETVRKIRKAASAIVKELDLHGPFNMQFLAKRSEIKVIECNVRAARSFPFVSKVVAVDLAKLATKIMLGQKPNLHRYNEDDLPYVGVKAAMFSFKRLAGADPVLGVEMAATGEVGCIGNDMAESLLLAMEASHVFVPRKGVLVSSGKETNKLKFLRAARVIRKLGIPLYATEGTAAYLKEHGFEVEALNWPSEKKGNVIDAIKSDAIDMVINIPKNSHKREISNGSKIRAAAIQYGCSLMTNIEKAVAFFEAIDQKDDFQKEHELVPLHKYLS